MKNTTKRKRQRKMTFLWQKKAVPPYHLFKVSGEYFMFDTTACRFYQIDEITSDFLLLSLSLSALNAAKVLIQSGKYEKDEIMAVKKEVVYLARHGLFDSVKSYIDTKVVKESIRQYNMDGGVFDIQLSLAENCNLSCKYCYCAKSNKQDKDVFMSEAVARKAVDFLVMQNVQHGEITLFGGEPLLNKPVVDFIMDYSKQEQVKKTKQINYIITTNATLLDDKTIDYIVNDNFGLMVSLDGPKELHDMQCPTKAGKGSYDIAAANIKKLMQRRTVGVRATMTHPMPDLKGLVDFFIDFGFHNMVIGATTNRVDAPSEYDFDCEDMKEYSRQQEKLLPWTLEYLQQGKNPPYFIFDKWYGMIASGSVFPGASCFNCGAGTSVVGVDSKGNFFPCSKFVGLKNWQIGNVDSGLNAEKSKTMWSKYIEAISPHCGKCWAYPICHGPCIWECARENGDVIFNDNYCEFMKKSVERSAYLYLKTQTASEEK